MPRPKRKKRIINKKWISVYFDSCPVCHGVPEIHTLSRKDDAYYHLDDVRCSAGCGNQGVFTITEGEFVGEINWQSSLS
jgi:protein tyrosine phosphatase